MSIQAIIVDDSITNQEGLELLLETYCPHVQLQGKAIGIEDAVGLIERHSPDLVFLDIEMGRGNGFDLFEKIPSPTFEVIFVTAYDAYSLEAIKHSALAYLLKPVDYKELIKAVAEASQRLNEKKKAYLYENLVQNLKAKQNGHDKFAIPTKKGFEFIASQMILYCEGAAEYSKIYLRNGRNILSTQRLNKIEEELQHEGFFRIHRSRMINLACVKEYHRGNGGVVIMENGTSLGVANSRKEELLVLLNAKKYPNIT